MVQFNVSLSNSGRAVDVWEVVHLNGVPLIDTHYF